MEQEIWKDIKGWEGFYQVSNLGRVKSLDRWYYSKEGTHVHAKERILALASDPKGYPFVLLCRNNTRKQIAVHRLVAMCFCEKGDNDIQVDHINTIRTDDRVENLRWVTHKENMNNSKTTRNKIVGASIAFKSKKIYVYDTSKSKRGKCVLSFLSPKTAAKFFGVHYRVIMKALDNANERVCGYLIRSERKTYKKKSATTSKIK